MSEKPFWVGKTCKEMANLRVKVTFKNGTVATGVTDECGDIDGVDSLSCVDVDDKFVPCSYVESIELLDDPEYERIDDIEDVREGDIFVANDGNKYLIDNVDTDRAFERCMAYLSYAPAFLLSDIAFAYALRPTPKLPDKPGLWLDKDDNTWVMGEGIAQVMCIGTDEWSVSRPWVSLDGVQVLNAAPFRPAKAVEA